MPCAAQRIFSFLYLFRPLIYVGAFETIFQCRTLCATFLQFPASQNWVSCYCSCDRWTGLLPSIARVTRLPIVLLANASMDNVATYNSLYIQTHIAIPRLCPF